MRSVGADSQQPIRTARTRVRTGRRRPTSAEIREALDYLRPPDRRGAAIVSLESRPFEYASSFAIEDVEVRLADGSHMHVLCKDTGRSALLPEARRVKPSFLADPVREIATYSSILHPLQLGAPRFYGAVIDKDQDHYWLFIDRINGSPLAEVGEFDVWLQASAWLARMHGDIELDQTPSIASVPLVHYSAAFYRRWMRRAQRFILESSSETRQRRVRFRWLMSHYDAIVEEIAALPTTFVHGEFYASNILVEGTSDVSIRPVDWELSGIGCPLMDLAALTAGWPEAPRAELAFSYYASLDHHAASWLPPDSFIRVLEGCHVQLAVQCLGWADHWRPPRQHSQDWLAAAVAAVERLGL